MINMISFGICLALLLQLFIKVGIIMLIVDIVTVILMSLSIIADVKRLGEEYTKEIEFNKDINVATNTFVLAVDQTELVVMDLILNFASIIKLWADSQD